MNRTYSNVLATSAAALAFALAAVSASAQPGHHPGPGGGSFGDQLGHVIQNAQAQLNLNPSQQQMFANNVAATKSAFATGRLQRQSVKDALTAELAKAEPDLAAVAAVADSAQQQGLALRHQVRDGWLALYATFTADQKAVVKGIIQQRIARMESFREKMLQHLSTGD